MNEFITLITECTRQNLFGIFEIFSKFLTVKPFSRGHLSCPYGKLQISVNAQGVSFGAGASFHSWRPLCIWCTELDKYPWNLSCLTSPLFRKLIKDYTGASTIFNKLVAVIQWSLLSLVTIATHFIICCCLKGQHQGKT